MTEEWRPVPYEPFNSNYLISNFGRVKVIKKSVYSHSKSNYMKQSWGSCGRYACVGMRYQGEYKQADIHRMVALAFLGSPPGDKTLACHLDGDRKNNRVDNLVWGSNTDNMRHMIEHGHSLKGTQIAISKLTDENVRTIRELYATECISQMTIADMFQVNQTIISDIVRGYTWKHI